MNDVATRQDELNASIAEKAQNYNLFEFIQGQKDCRDGVQHVAGKGESYDAGFSTEYAAEQTLDNQSQRAYE